MSLQNAAVWLASLLIASRNSAGLILDDRVQKMVIPRLPGTGGQEESVVFKHGRHGSNLVNEYCRDVKPNHSVLVFSIKAHNG